MQRTPAVHGADDRRRTDSSLKEQGLCADAQRGKEFIGGCDYIRVTEISSESCGPETLSDHPQDKGHMNIP
jgi:hypothetical protein